MAPKRQRGSSSRPADDEDVEIQGGSDEGDAGAGPSEPQHQRRQQRRGASASASGGAAAGAAAAAPATDRAAQAADIARRRAAHFARFQDDADGGGADGDGGDNVHVGGDNARTLGPWSSAVELVNARQRAAAARDEKILEAARAAARKQDEISWAPSRDPALGPRAPASRVPPLLNISLGLLVRHIDDVASLWGVPDAIKAQLAAAVCARRAMSPGAAQLFAEHAPCEVVLPNCTQLDAEAMARLLTTAASARLERLELGCCGRGFTDAAARALLEAAPALPALAALRLQGAYNLTSGALCSVLAAASSSLRRLSLAQGSKIDGAVVERLPDLAPHLEELDLSECRGVPGDALRAALPRMRSLRRLALDGIPEVDDALVLAVAPQLPALSALSLAMCAGVSDAGLVGVAKAAPALEELVIDDVARASDAALLALSEHCRRLHTLSARRCAKLTDAGLVALAEACPLRRVAVAAVPGAGAPFAAALARRCGGSLEALDVSFCRGVPEAGLGLLADSCPKLADLRVYGCTQVTDRLVDGHSSDSVRFAGLATSVRGGGGGGGGGGAVAVAQ